MKKIILKYPGFLPMLLLITIMSCQSGTFKEVIEHYENGNPKLERYYQNNNGKPILIKEIYYHENGNKRVEGAISEGKREGVWMFWFEHGSLWREVNYSKSNPDGIAKAYHENGALFYQGTYLQGEKHGEWSFYDVEGKLVNQLIFEKGKLKSQTSNKQ